MNDFLKTVLPWIGTAVAGPFGGMAVKFFAEKLGASAETTEDVTNWLRGANPADVLRAKQADQEFQLEMEKLGYKKLFDLEQLNTQDRMNAREREIKTGDNTNRRLAMVYTIGYFALLSFACFKGFPQENKEILNALLGILSAAQLQIMNYYFGSSKSSSDKNDILLSAVKGDSK